MWLRGAISAYAPRMSGDTLERFISESKLFSMLDPEGRDRLTQAGTTTSFPVGATLMKEGEIGDAFFVLVSGNVRVTADDFGVEKHLANLGPGAVCGEIAALTNEPRTATVTVEEPVKALRFERNIVMEVLRDYPKVLGLLNRIGLMRSEATLERMLGD